MPKKIGEKAVRSNGRLSADIQRISSQPLALSALPWLT